MGNSQAKRSTIGWLRGVLFLPGLLFLAGLASPALADRRQQDPIILIPGETVYIEVIQSTVTHQPGFSWTDSGRSDRFFKFSQALEEAFAEREVPLKLKVVRWGANVPKDATTATLTLIRWHRNGLGEIEARIIVQLKKGGSKTNLGVFVGTEGAMTMASSSMEERVYHAAALKASTRLADRMNEQINF